MPLIFYPSGLSVKYAMGFFGAEIVRLRDGIGLILNMSSNRDMKAGYVDASMVSSGNPDKALNSALRLVEEGFYEAGFLVGAIYETRGEFDKAGFYYEIAFQKGDSVLACVGLARLNFLGRCKGGSPEKAFEYYNYLYKSAGHPMAKMMLCRMYLDGVGAKKDLSKAEVLLLESAAEGYVFSYSFLAKLYRIKGRYAKAVLFGFRGWVAYILSDKTSLSSSYM